MYSYVYFLTGVFVLKLIKNHVCVNLVLGDLVGFDGDVIVNPANKYFVMSGGVTAVIKEKRSVEIELENTASIYH